VSALPPSAPCSHDLQRRMGEWFESDETEPLFFDRWSIDQFRGIWIMQFAMKRKGMGVAELGKVAKFLDKSASIL
jgi:hypothetical protein